MMYIISKIIFYILSYYFECYMDALKQNRKKGIEFFSKYFERHEFSLLDKNKLKMMYDLCFDKLCKDKIKNLKLDEVLLDSFNKSLSDDLLSDDEQKKLSNVLVQLVDFNEKKNKAINQIIHFYKLISPKHQQVFYVHCITQNKGWQKDYGFEFLEDIEKEFNFKPLKNADINGNDLLLQCLTACAYKSNIKTFKHLIEKYGWDVKTKNKFTNYNVYQTAAKHGHVNILQYLDNEHNWEMDMSGDVTAPGLSIIHNRRRVIKYFIDKHSIDFTQYNIENYELKRYVYQMCGKNYSLVINKFKEIKECSFEKIKSEQCKMNDDNLCAICYEEFQKGSVCCLCVNNHIIHKSCYLESLIHQHTPWYSNVKLNKCVYCRQEVPIKIYQLIE